MTAGGRLHGSGRRTPAEEGMAAARQENALERLVGSLVLAESSVHDGTLQGEIVGWNVGGAVPLLKLCDENGEIHWIYDDEITAYIGTIDRVELDGSVRTVPCTIPVD
jgi:hypothetical protein